MTNNESIDEITLDFDGWNTQKLIVALKSYDGRLFVDARKWMIYPDKNISTRRGLMLDLLQWPKAIEAIQGFIKQNASVQKP